MLVEKFKNFQMKGSQDSVCGSGHDSSLELANETQDQVEVTGHQEEEVLVETSAGLVNPVAMEGMSIQNSNAGRKKSEENLGQQKKKKLIFPNQHIGLKGIMESDKRQSQRKMIRKKKEKRKRKKKKKRKGGMKLPRLGGVLEATQCSEAIVRSSCFLCGFHRISSSLNILLRTSGCSSAAFKQVHVFQRARGGLVTGCQSPVDRQKMKSQSHKRLKYKLVAKKIEECNNFGRATIGSIGVLRGNTNATTVNTCGFWGNLSRSATYPLSHGAALVAKKTRWSSGSSPHVDQIREIQIPNFSSQSSTIVADRAVSSTSYSQNSSLTE